MIAEEFSFERQAGRRPGEEDKRSFRRRGMVGDWRNHFNHEARELFDRYAGSELILLGYERDRSWVRDREGDVAGDVAASSDTSRSSS
jgi:Sulfotransferase domain